MLNKFPLLIILFLSCYGHSQCVICKSIDEALKKPEKVKFLDLSAQALSEVPPEIEQLTNLQFLDLSDNVIFELDAGSLKLGELKSLDLSNNPGFNGVALFGLKDAFPSLVSLNLSNNAMSEVSPEIGELQSLVELYLNGNNLKFLPQEIEGLGKLKILDLSYNSMEECDLLFSELWKIQNLNMEGNEKINLFDLGTSLQFKDDLKHLSVSTMRQRKVLPKSFRDLPIEELCLQGATIETLNGAVAASKTIKVVVFKNCEFVDGRRIIGWINRLPALESVQFLECDVPAEVSQLQNIDHLMFDNCDFDDPVKLHDIKPQIQLEFIDCDIQLDDNARKAKESSYHSSESHAIDYGLSEAMVNNTVEPIVESRPVEIKIMSREARKVELPNSIFEIPSEAFLTQEGNIYSGEVTLKIKEYYDPLTTALNGAPMIYRTDRDNLFASSGMIDFRAYDDQGRELTPNPTEPIEVELRDVQPGESPDLYFFDEAENNWEIIDQPEQTNFDAIRMEFMDSIANIDAKSLVMMRTIPALLSMTYKKRRHDPTEIKFKQKGPRLYKITSATNKEKMYTRDIDQKSLCNRTWKIDSVVTDEQITLLKNIKRDLRRSKKKTKGSNQAYYDNVPRIINDLKIEPNFENDNYDMTFRYRGETIRFPVYDDLNGGISRIQAKEKRNYSIYIKRQKAESKNEKKIKAKQEKYLPALANRARQRQMDFVNMNGDFGRRNEALRFTLSMFGLLNCDFIPTRPAYEMIQLAPIAMDQNGHEVDVPMEIRNVLLNDNTYLMTGGRTFPKFSRVEAIALIEISDTEIGVIKKWKRQKDGKFRAEIVRISIENLSEEEVRYEIMNA